MKVNVELNNGQSAQINRLPQLKKPSAETKIFEKTLDNENKWKELIEENQKQKIMLAKVQNRNKALCLFLREFKEKFDKFKLTH